MNDNDGYNAEANAYECWKLAIRSMRLDEIRAGRATPRTDDAEEMEAKKLQEVFARIAGV
jgi:hypothetical protein